MLSVNEDTPLNTTIGIALVEEMVSQFEATALSSPPSHDAMRISTAAKGHLGAREERRKSA